MNKVTAVIGLPRSGKNTFCGKWANEKDPDGLRRFIVSGDWVRLAYYGKRYIGKLEKFVHPIYETMIEALLMQDGIHLMLNDTHTSKHSIEKILNIDINTQFIFIDTSPEICKRRAYETNQADLVEGGVIDRMYDHLKTLASLSIKDMRDSFLQQYDGPSYANYTNVKPSQDNIQNSIEIIRKRVKNKNERSN